MGSTHYNSNVSWGWLLPLSLQLSFPLVYKLMTNKTSHTAPTEVRGDVDLPPLPTRFAYSPTHTLSPLGSLVAATANATTKDKTTNADSAANDTTPPVSGSNVALTPLPRVEPASAPTTNQKTTLSLSSNNTAGTRNDSALTEAEEEEEEEETSAQAAAAPSWQLKGYLDTQQYRASQSRDAADYADDDEADSEGDADDANAADDDFANDEAEPPNVTQLTADEITWLRERAAALYSRFLELQQIVASCTPSYTERKCLLTLEQAQSLHLFTDSKQLILNGEPVSDLYDMRHNFTPVEIIRHYRWGSLMLFFLLHDFKHEACALYSLRLSEIILGPLTHAELALRLGKILSVKVFPMEITNQLPDELNDADDLLKQWQRDSNEHFYQQRVAAYPQINVNPLLLDYSLEHLLTALRARHQGLPETMAHDRTAAETLLGLNDKYLPTLLASWLGMEIPPADKVQKDANGQSLPPQLTANHVKEANVHALWVFEMQYQLQHLILQLRHVPQSLLPESYQKLLQESEMLHADFGNKLQLKDGKSILHEILEPRSLESMLGAAQPQAAEEKELSQPQEIDSEQQLQIARRYYYQRWLLLSQRLYWRYHGKPDNHQEISSMRSGTALVDDILD